MSIIIIIIMLQINESYIYTSAEPLESVKQQMDLK